MIHGGQLTSLAGSAPPRNDLANSATNDNPTARWPAAALRHDDGWRRPSRSDLGRLVHFTHLESTHTLPPTNQEPPPPPPDILPRSTSGPLPQAGTAASLAAAAAASGSAASASAVEIAARVLGYRSWRALHCRLSRVPLAAAEHVTLARHFLGARATFTHRAGGGLISGLDPRPAASIGFQRVEGTGSSKKSRKRGRPGQVELVFIAEYLTKKYSKLELLFADTLPCFKIANEDGRVDFFPLELCFIDGGGCLLVARPTQDDRHMVEILAETYRLRGDNIAALCAHNASAAAALSASHLELLWSMLGVLLAPSDQLPSSTRTAALPTSSTLRHSPPRRKRRAAPQMPAAASPSSPPQEGGSGDASAGAGGGAGAAESKDASKWTPDSTATDPTLPGAHNDNQAGSRAAPWQRTLLALREDERPLSTAGTLLPGLAMGEEEDAAAGTPHALSSSSLQAREHEQQMVSTTAALAMLQVGGAAAPTFSRQLSIGTGGITAVGAAAAIGGGAGAAASAASAGGGGGSGGGGALASLAHSTRPLGAQLPSQLDGTNGGSGGGISGSGSGQEPKPQADSLPLSAELTGTNTHVGDGGGGSTGVGEEDELMDVVSSGLAKAEIGQSLAIDGPPVKSGLLSELAVQTVRDLLDERCTAGDVQTCVSICEVVSALGEDAVDLISEKMQRREWYWWYIELLHRLQLWLPANEIATNCRDPKISEMTTKSTSIYTSCANCRKPLVGKSSHTWCAKCRNAVSTCVLCQQPVRGLYVVCPGCGHGGHLAHLRSWFSKEQTCPSGCGHRCDFRSFHHGPSL